MDINLATTFLPHTDPEASLAFYRDALGFELKLDVGEGTMRWLTVAPAGSATSIVLTPPGVAETGISEAEKATILGLMAKGAYASIILATDDLEGLFERIEASGAEIIQEPTDQSWGVRDCAVRDPAGNTVRIQQRS